MPAAISRGLERQGGVGRIVSNSSRSGRIESPDSVSSSFAHFFTVSQMKIAHDEPSPDLGPVSGSSAGFPAGAGGGGPIANGKRRRGQLGVIVRTPRVDGDCLLPELDRFLMPACLEREMAAPSSAVWRVESCEQCALVRSQSFLGPSETAEHLPVGFERA